MTRRYIVLAAGSSTRMGFDKVVAGSPSPLQLVARALGSRSAIVVVPSRLKEIASSAMPHAQFVVNDEPERGMTHSLRLAIASIGPSDSFGVLLADMPAMTEATIARTEALMNDGADVAYPSNEEGQPGHPVLFSPRARFAIEALPDGDTLRLARDDASLSRATWICTDRSAFLDLDVPAQWEAFASA